MAAKNGVYMAHVQTSKPPVRMATLDLLRLVAALAVVGFHFLFRGELASDGHDQAYPSASGFAIYGYLGVNLFFLISGFVIAWSAEGRDFARFALARFARLYPGFIVCMTITFLTLLIAADPAFPVSFVQFVANLIMFSPALGQPFMDGVYWSIVLEVIFYGWVAVALFFGVFERWKTGLLAGWLLLSAANEFLLGSGALRLIFLTEYGPLFVAGILLHHMHSRGYSLEGLSLFIAAFFMSTATMISGQGWMQVHYGQAVPLTGLVLANITIYGLMLAAIRFNGSIASSPLILMLGGLTYPLYLLHQHIGYIALDAVSPLLGSWGAFAAITAVLLILSWIIWRFIETPARKAIMGFLIPYADMVSQRFVARKMVAAE